MTTTDVDLEIKVNSDAAIDSNIETDSKIPQKRKESKRIKKRGYSIWVSVKTKETLKRLARHGLINPNLNSFYRNVFREFFENEAELLLRKKRCVDNPDPRETHLMVYMNEFLINNFKRLVKGGVFKSLASAIRYPILQILNTSFFKERIREANASEKENPRQIVISEIISTDPLPAIDENIEKDLV